MNVNIDLSGAPAYALAVAGVVLLVSQTLEHTALGSAKPMTPEVCTAICWAQDTTVSRLESYACECEPENSSEAVETAEEAGCPVQ